ncbi:MAG TPA: twin-arginine translocation signal domain-containing protein [Gaiellaceae bacterium]|nr:twin-arginine translocation signal domain-containing protein [Gaiellaceae bacterium]
MVLETKDLSRRRLLKRVAIGGGVVYAAPFMTSAALAGSENGKPRCNAVPGEEPKTCGPGTCADQTICRGEIPDGSFCTCIPRRPGNGNEQGEGQCFCHEASACSDLTECENSGDCPPGWACAASCCSDGEVWFCHPPCGTSAAGSIAAIVGASGPTSVG